MYKKGNAFKDTTDNGWIYGHFIQEKIANDNRIEIKIATLPKTFTSKPHYNKNSTKIDIVWTGHAIWEINNTSIHMRKGDYVIIQPGTPVCIKKILTNVITVQTIRFPSIPDDKVFLE